MQPTGEALFYPKQHMIIAAYASGVMPLGFVDSVAGFGDWEKFRKMVRRSRDFGFLGAGCIHPGQVTIVNEEYTPTADEVEYAKKVIQLDKEAAAAGRGSFSDRRQDDRRSGRRARRETDQALRRDQGARSENDGGRQGLRIPDR